MTHPEVLVHQRRSFAPWLVALLLLLAASLLSGTSRALAATAVTTGTLKSSCPSPGTATVPGFGTVRDYSGKTLVLCNFSRANMPGTKFTNATLIAVVFDGADLRGADFSGATFADSGNVDLPTDFSFAFLTSASFNKATFKGLTYLTYANLICADFSNTDISTPNVVFGPSPLNVKGSDGCMAGRLRTTFAGTKMNCEFVNDWNFLDMTGATNLGACAAQYPAHDFSGGMLDSADFSTPGNVPGLNLAGTTWTGASLRRAKFDNATLDNAKGLDGASKTQLSGASFSNVSAKLVDFSGANLSGANFTNAELQGANFSGAKLTNDPLDPLGPISDAAKFEGAHLKYVNFAGASLNSVTFTYASLYGSLVGAPDANGATTCQTNTTGTGQTNTTSTNQCGSATPTGATCSCATLRGANLTRTNFTNAFLYGVDLSTSNTIINGTNFTSAVLVAANFQGAKISTDGSQGGGPPDFSYAWLQGAQFDTGATTLNNVSLLRAFVDFGFVNTDGSTRLSSNLALQLTANHTGFHGWTGSKTPCVYVENAQASALPTGSSMTCPNGAAGPCGAGTPGTLDKNGLPSGGNPAWFGGTVASATPITGWYRRPSTYELAASAPPRCTPPPQGSGW